MFDTSESARVQAGLTGNCGKDDRPDMTDAGKPLRKKKKMHDSHCRPGLKKLPSRHRTPTTDLSHQQSAPDE